MANEFHCYTDMDLENVDSRRFPQFKEARVIDVVIGPGDLLFLPVGWWHHVRALDVSITVTFTDFVVNNDFHTGYTTYGDV
jgi:ribosomal protein L16 Arg81 hydroxylase